MSNPDEMQGNFLRIPKKTIKEIKDYQVIIGFSGFGNVGYLALTHLVEVLNVNTIAFWGSSSWYHKGRLESILTVYQHKESKTIFVVPRIPVHITNIPQKYWDEFAEEILIWRCRRYIIIGGLKEDTRSPNSLEWAGYVTTPEWERQFDEKRTMRDHLAMIGPLSSFLTLGTAIQLPVLGLLAYCNFEEDPEAALLAVKEIVKFCKIDHANTEKLQRFNFTFIPAIQLPLSVDESEDTEDDMPGYDLNELI